MENNLIYLAVHPKQSKDSLCSSFAEFSACGSRRGDLPVLWFFRVSLRPLPEHALQRINSRGNGDNCITMSTDDAERARVTEQTPLLREADPASVGPSDGHQPEEASTKELIITLASIWLGVFLAALGMTMRPMIMEYQLTETHCRFNDRRDAVSTDLLLI